MATVEWYKWNVLLLTICLLIGWNYWLTNFLWGAPFTLVGGPSVDFHYYYLAGRAWLSQVNPYSYVVPYGAGFVYPPTFLPFFGMFALGEFRFASQLWWITYFSVFVVAALALALTIRGEKRYLYSWITVLLFLTSYPSFWLFYLGQNDLLIASLTILSLVCERLRRPFASAFLLSIGTLMKGSAVFFLIYFVIFRKDLRYLVHFLISTLVIVGASLLVVPWKLYWYYMVTVLPGTYSQYERQTSQTIVRLLYLAGMNRLALQATSLAVVCLFAIFSFYASSNRWTATFGKRTVRADAMFLMNGLIILLVSPRSLIYPYVWVILPLALFLSTLLMERVKIGYLMFVGFATFFLNSVLSPDFLAGIYQILPLEIIGNLMMIISLIPIHIRPTAIIRRAK